MSFIVLIFLSFLIITIIPFFSIFVQTIKNLIFFIFLVVVLSVNLMLHLNIEFFPLFFILVYVGAIIVSTLFMVLTFDLRSEYNKKIFSDASLFNCFVYFSATPVFLFVLNYFKKYLWLENSPDALDRVAVYHECMSTPFISARFCDAHFGRTFFDSGLYGAVNQKTNDLLLISNNLYTSYALLFLILGIVLTLALFAALAIIKQDVLFDGSDKKAKKVI